MVDAVSCAFAADPAAGWTSWPAPAKLNLFLHITGRRADGYHRLQTVFQLLDHGDSVHLRVRDDGRIERHQPLPGVAADADLATRAACLLREAAGLRAGADIGLTKRIPQGGLGGGSSDAATTLRALNRLWGVGASVADLARLGLQLGADVPVFVHGRSAWAEGVGEELVPLALPPRWFVVIDPGVRVGTRELFAAPELTRTAPRLTIPLFHSGLATGNAFEPVVRARFPAVAGALDWLGNHGAARLTGSGGCVFTEVASREAGVAVLGRLPADLQGFVARGVNESPLLDRLRRTTSANGAG